MEEEALANRRVVRDLRVEEQEDNTDIRDTTPAERIAMMWQLTLDVWAFTGEPLHESRLLRQIARVIRPSH